MLPQKDRVRDILCCVAVWSFIIDFSVHKPQRIVVIVVVVRPGGAWNNKMQVTGAPCVIYAISQGTRRGQGTGAGGQGTADKTSVSSIGTNMMYMILLRAVLHCPARDRESERKRAREMREQVPLLVPIVYRRRTAVARNRPSSHSLHSSLYNVTCCDTAAIISYHTIGYDITSKYIISGMRWYDNLVKQ